MSEETRRRELIEELEAAIREQTGPEADRRSQRRARRAWRGPADYPRPLEFDANGFPVSQRSSSFAIRVARLLNP
jgi:hypothetical protein